MIDTTTISVVDRAAKLEAEMAYLDEEIGGKQIGIEDLHGEICDLEMQRREFREKLEELERLGD